MPPFDDAQIDIKALRKYYGSNPVAQAILDYFSNRQKNSSATKVDRLMHSLVQAGHEFARRDVIGVLKKFEELGCGAFVIGRRGQPSRFEWDVQMISVAKASQGEGDFVGRITPDEESVYEEEEEEFLRSGMLRHPFRLRPDLTITLDLPDDLTAKEAARLGDFIKTLPFDSDMDD